MDCIVFIHSSVDGHLGLFPTLDYCEQCSPELERLAFPSKVLSPLNPRHHSRGAAFMLQWQSWRVVSESVWPKLCIIWLFTEKICWLLSEWIWELGHLGETARFFFFTQYVFFIVGWQCVNFCCTTKWFNYTYICIFFFKNILFTMVYRVMCVLVAQSCPCDPMWPHGL